MRLGNINRQYVCARDKEWPFVPSYTKWVMHRFEAFSILTAATAMGDIQRRLA